MAIPEKYLMPASLCAVHEINSGNVADKGAPHPGGKVTSHGPVISIGEVGEQWNLINVDREVLQLSVIPLLIETICFLSD